MTGPVAVLIFENASQDHRGTVRKEMTGAAQQVHALRSDDGQPLHWPLGGLQTDNARLTDAVAYVLFGDLSQLSLTR